MCLMVWPATTLYVICSLASDSSSVKLSAFLATITQNWYTKLLLLLVDLLDYHWHNLKIVISIGFNG